MATLNRDHRQTGIQRTEPERQSIGSKLLFGVGNAFEVGCLLVFAFTLALLLTCGIVWCTATMCLQ